MPVDAKRVQKLFRAALEAGEPAKQVDLLDRECGADAELRQRVEALLTTHRDSAGTLDHPVGVAFDDMPRDPTTTIAHANEDDVTSEAGPSDESREYEEDVLTFLAPPGRPDSLGRIGHYEVLEVLGRGSFGVVFRAFDESLQHVVAVKVLSPSLAATSPARKRFLREARSAAAVSHENVVQIHETGESPLPYLVMEFIPGETLQQRLDRLGPQFLETLRTGRQVAEGLAAAHETGLIHRDVKPGNVLLERTSPERVKLTDFGLARAADAEMTQNGTAVSTPMYMAPEQAKGGHIDHRADLFNLGSVLYAMCTGRPPFRATTTLAVMKRVVEDDPRPIREIIPETPEWLCDIISKLHAKDPAERIQTAREVAAILADREQRLKVHAGPNGFSRNSLGKPARRRGRSRWAAALVCLVLAGLGVYALTRPGQRPTPVQGGPAPAVVTPVATATDPPLAVAPFGAAKAKEHQEAWAKHLGLDVEITNTVGMRFRLIPPGTWAEGQIATAFYLGVFEVTQAQYERIVGNNPALYHKDKGGGPDHPVEMISWNEARELCRLLSGLPAEKAAGCVYRLPTRAEQFFAAQAGSTGHYCFGNAVGELGKYAWYAENSQDRTHPVGRKMPNAWGLHDVHGNVSEYCAEPVVLGGGSFWHPAPQLTTANVFPSNAETRVRFDGLRLVMTVPTVQPPRTVVTSVEKKATENDEIRLVGKFEGHEGETLNVAVSPDGRYALSSGTDNTVRLWAFPGGKPLAVFPGTVWGFAFSPNGRLALGGGSGPAAQIPIWDLDKRQQVGKLRGHTGHIFSVALSPDARFALSCSVDQTVRYWDIAAQKELKRFPLRIGWNCGVTFLPGGQQALVCPLSPENAIYLFDLQNGSLTKHLSLGRSTNGMISVTSDGRHVVAALHDGQIARCDLKTKTVTMMGEDGKPVCRLEYFPDSRHVVSVDMSRMLRIFDTMTGIQLAVVEAHEAVPVNALALSPDGQYALTGGRNFEIWKSGWKSKGFALSLWRLPERAWAKPPLAVAPLEASKATECQEAWAKHFGAPVEIPNAIGMRLRLIPPGEFTMGSSAAEIDRLLTQAPDLKEAEWHVRREGPERRVTIREPFLLGAHEVTVGQFREFVEATKYATEAERNGGGFTWDASGHKWVRDPANVWNHPKLRGGANHPVVFVTPVDISAFCDWLSRKDGRTYVLPTEEQWEYACRAGTNTSWFFGDNPADMRRYGWTAEQSLGEHHPVGQLAANPFGLFDTHGNVAELVFDTQRHVYERGGRSNETARRARSAWQYPVERPTEPHARRGFRVAVVGDLTTKLPAPEALPSPRILP